MSGMGPTARNTKVVESPTSGITATEITATDIRKEGMTVRDAPPTGRSNGTVRIVVVTPVHVAFPETDGNSR